MNLKLPGWFRFVLFLIPRSVCGSLRRVEPPERELGSFPRSHGIDAGFPVFRRLILIACSSYLSNSFLVEPGEMVRPGATAIGVMK
jgi:hypothetical protein